MFQLLVVRHHKGGPGFAFDDSASHAFGRALVGQVAITAEVPEAPVDRQREEDAGDQTVREFAHGEYPGLDRERRQYLKRVVVGCLGDLEPFAAVERAVVPLPYMLSLVR